ncbi:uncharacterized protein BDW47DRAFT_78728 [Aspergillus candidus]|uniref:Transmembrane protein n=1 Tax=Aspergillus candidus TaxID=41067 RepID=A0A2I2F108_ASPCN|nr:hypothetical protein BDW47DRAFT_78728 [Aspergillus candidus]PLB34323.1 hypothetical protein BDW47DRAFT_78728 [Aspergillus candidus]
MFTSVEPRASRGFNWTRGAFFHDYVDGEDDSRTRSTWMIALFFFGFPFLFFSFFFSMTPSPFFFFFFLSSLVNRCCPGCYSLVTDVRIPGIKRG